MLQMDIAPVEDGSGGPDLMMICISFRGVVPLKIIDGSGGRCNRQVTMTERAFQSPPFLMALSFIFNSHFTQIQSDNSVIRPSSCT